MCHSCLRSWFQRQQTCPTCRMDVLRASQPNPTPAPAAQAPPAAPANAPAPPAANGKHQPSDIIINQRLLHSLLMVACILFSCSRSDAPISPRPFPFLGSLPWCSSSCCSSCSSGSLQHTTDNQCRCNPNNRSR